MSVDTLGVPLRNVTPAEVLGVVRTLFDKNAELAPLPSDRSMAKKGYVEFNYQPDGRRMLWVFVQDYDDGYIECPAPPLPRTYLDFGMWGHSEEIMTKVLAALGGGYVVPSDSDSETYYKVEGDLGAVERYKKEMPRIVTMADIKEVFGDNIILDLKEEK